MAAKLQTDSIPERMTIDQLPSPPAAMRMILRASSDHAVSLDDLAELVCYEPSFAVELLRSVNSAYYNRKKPICSARRATLTLGAREVRNHAVAHVLRVAAQNLDLGDFDAHLFWEDSVRRATISLVLAEIAGCEDPQDACTVGLIQDGGILLLAATWPDKALELQNNRSLTCDQRLKFERDLCGTDHAELLGLVGARWGLPDDIVDAITGHHDPAAQVRTRRASRLLEISRVADAISDVFPAPMDKAVLTRAVALLSRLPSRRNVSLSEVITAVEQRAPSVAKEQRIHYRDQDTIGGLVSEAVASMVRITTHYEHVTKELEALLLEKKRMTQRLEQSNSQLTRLATTDSLTGIANRRYFTEVLKHTFDDGARAKNPTSLLMFDIDHFKAVNDTHGHAAGDDVLRVITERVGRILRPSDLQGRLGGEEFAVVLPNTDEESALAVAERARLAIYEEPIRTRGGVLIPVSASFGGITVRQRSTPDDMLRCADDAMYISKSEGRNTITWMKP
jgi:diguanylate cyclase (GGDEF)-like protein